MAFGCIVIYGKFPGLGHTVADVVVSAELEILTTILNQIYLCAGNLEFLNK